MLRWRGREGESMGNMLVTGGWQHWNIHGLAFGGGEGGIDGHIKNDYEGWVFELLLNANKNVRMV